MKRSELDKYLGKFVKITFFDNTTDNGKLKSNIGEFEIDHYYRIGDELKTYQRHLFTCHHVKEVENISQSGLECCPNCGINYNIHQIGYKFCGDCVQRFKEEEVEE